MEQFLSFNIGQIGQVIVLLIAVGIMFQTLRGDIKYHGDRLEKVETRLEKVETVVVVLARQEERIAAMDQRMLAQGQRIDSQAMIINGRLEAINNIVSGHTAKLDRVQFKGQNP